MNLFKKRHINLLIVPEDDSKGIKLRFSTKTFWLLVAVLCFIIVVYLISLITYGKVFTVAILSSSLAEENKKLKEYNSKVVMLEKELEEYREFALKVAELAGISPPFADQKEKSSTLIKSISSDSSSLSPGNSKINKKNLAYLRKIKNAPIDLPVQGGWLSRSFEEDSSDFQSFHLGIDLAVKPGTPIKATADGMVKFAGNDSIFGNLIILDHFNGFTTYYGHNSIIKVKTGQKVQKGEIIALSGNTGKSSAPHLHYEIRKEGTPLDPKDFIKNLKERK
jgi:murein DD-endopeptidase MepM/ murein hydrolase activator NlpD